MDKSTGFARERGNIPDRYWYQLNGEDPIDNYREQKEKILQRKNEQNVDLDKRISEAVDEIIDGMNISK